MDNNISSGSLKTKISLKNGNTQVALPFYGMKPKLPPPSTILGSDDLIARFDLSSAFNRFCGPKKPKEDLASFIGGICGISSLNMSIKDPSCSLRNLVDKPPITGREIIGLSSSAMAGFKLAAGPIPENYRFFEVQPGDSALLSGQETTSTDKTTANTSDADPASQKRLKRSLEDFEVPEIDKKTKKHRGEDKSERKAKKKKKEKKRDKEKDKRGKEKESRELPFY
ncbi:Mediator of RNA polymerase II transcription subunit 19 [Aphelenchoides bicaudatus]|nr:Mediator of RNA polymerase II transcription subunit 19 [Aphelenchoides bicaudatus]